MKRKQVKGVPRRRRGEAKEMALKMEKKETPPPGGFCSRLYGGTARGGGKEKGSPVET